MAFLYRDLFYDHTFNSIFEADQQVDALLTFEKELATAQSLQALIPESAAQAIQNICQVQRIDLERLILDSTQGGNLLIPLIKQCAELLQEDASGSYNYLHYGATSQDAIDTASMMQYKKACYWIHSKLRLLILHLVDLANEYRHTPMIGRTFLQQAKPITFGFKVTSWIDGLIQVYHSLAKLEFPIQLGGAVGTWNGMNGSTYEVLSTTLASSLQLDNPLKPWHNQRQSVVQIASTLGLLNGHLSKMTKDLTLMAQTEIGEISFEALDKGQSSSMPHKKNPVSGMLILANNVRIPHLVSTMLECLTGEHERALGYWHAEWGTMEELFKLIAGSMKWSAEMLQSIQVRPERMLNNLKMTNGLVFAESVGQAFAVKFGKIIARDLIEKACVESKSTGIPLQTILAGKPEIVQHFTLKALDELFEVENNLGLTEHFISVTLNRARTILVETI